MGLHCDCLDERRLMQIKIKWTDFQLGDRISVILHHSILRIPLLSQACLWGIFKSNIWKTLVGVYRYLSCRRLAWLRNGLVYFKEFVYIVHGLSVYPQILIIIIFVALKFNHPDNWHFLRFTHVVRINEGTYSSLNLHAVQLYETFIRRLLAKASRFSIFVHHVYIMHKDILQIKNKGTVKKIMKWRKFVKIYLNWNNEMKWSSSCFQLESHLQFFACELRNTL